jgi:hypothetical protein
VPHQQLLREHAATAVNRHIPALGPPGLETGDNILEKIGSVRAACVAVFPQVALQVLVVGSFHVASREIADVRFKSRWRRAMFGGKGIAVGNKFVRVPLGGEDVGQCGESVRELKMIDRILSLLFLVRLRIADDWVRWNAGVTG